MTGTYSLVKDLVTGERTGAVYSSHSARGLISKGAGLTAKKPISLMQENVPDDTKPPKGLA